MYSTRSRRVTGLWAMAAVLLVCTTAFSWSSGYEPGDAAFLSLLAPGVALLVPIGLALLASGGFPDERAALAALMGSAALSIAVIGYLLTGFAFQFGGIGLVTQVTGLKDLIWEWSFLDANWGLGWGVIGLRGFVLSLEASGPAAYALFFSQVAPVATAALIPLLALRNRVRPLVALVTALVVSMVIYPIVGNWAWGGGWLANLGINLGWGHGFVDFAGAGVIHLIGACVAFAGLIVFAPVAGDSLETQPARMPAIQLPILSVLGSFIVLPGALGIALGNPLIAGTDIAGPVIVVNLTLAAAGGALLAMLYSWFTTGQPNVYMTSRGLVCGVVAISAVCPFVPAWLALLIGAFAGLLLPLTSYLFTYVVRLSDHALVVPIHGISAVWGLLTVGLFASGEYGAGWNRMGVEQYLGVKGQGVTGLLTAANVQPDFPLQFYAQIVGIAALAAFAFAIAWSVFRFLSVFTAPVQPQRADPPVVIDSAESSPTPPQSGAPAGPAQASPHCIDPIDQRSQ